MASKDYTIVLVTVKQSMIHNRIIEATIYSKCVILTVCNLNIALVCNINIIRLLFAIDKYDEDFEPCAILQNRSC